LVSDRHFSVILLILFSFMMDLWGQEEVTKKISGAKIDSLLTEYHLAGIKIFVEKLGVLSVEQKKVKIDRKLYDDRLKINIQRSLLLSKHDFEVNMQYRINPKLFLYGKSVSSLKGSKNSINFLYKLEY